MIPPAQLILQMLHRRANKVTRWFYALDAVLPLLLKTIPQVGNERENTLPSVNLINGNRIVVSLTSYLGLILTFGTVFPPLAASLIITVLAIVYFTQYKVGNFLIKAKAQNQLQYIESIEQECRAVGKLPILMNSMWMLISVSACFYTLFLFDTLGDAVGFQGAYWVLIVMPMMPLCLYFTHTYYQTGCRLCCSSALCLFQLKETGEVDVNERAKQVELSSVNTSNTELNSTTNVLLHDLNL